MRLNRRKVFSPEYMKDWSPLCLFQFISMFDLDYKTVKDYPDPRWEEQCRPEWRPTQPASSHSCEQL